MRICLVCVEIFAWGKYGGFGRATRLIGRELKRQGIEVYAVVPRRGNQRPVEELDGIHVLGFKSYNLFEAYRLYQQVEAYIYHSQEPSIGTYLAMKAMPERKHVVTFRDPRLFKDWWVEFFLPSVNHLQVFSSWLYEDNPLVHLAVRQADRLFAASHLAGEKAKIKYHLKNNPEFLPTPVFAPSLDSYSLIGVRDDLTLEIVSESKVDASVPVVRMPDPTFLHEYKRTQAHKIMEQHGIDPNRPILGLLVYGKPALSQELGNFYRRAGF